MSEKCHATRDCCGCEEWDDCDIRKERFPDELPSMEFVYHRIRDVQWRCAECRKIFRVSTFYDIGMDLDGTIFCPDCTEKEKAENKSGS